MRFKQQVHELEVKKFRLSILTPLLLLLLTFVVNNALQERSASLRRDEQILADKKRIYTEIGPKLNIFYIYVADVGDFKAYTPARVVDLKREVDRQFHIYHPYWSAGTQEKYSTFMESVFQTYSGVGLPAQINGSPIEKIAAYENDQLKWDPAWNRYFTGNTDLNVSEKYYALVKSLLADTVDPSVGKGDNKDKK